MLDVVLRPNKAMNGSGNKRVGNGESTHRPVIANVRRSGRSHESSSLALLADTLLAKSFCFSTGFCFGRV